MSSEFTIRYAEQDEKLGLIEDLKEAYRAFIVDNVTQSPVQPFRKTTRLFLGVNSELEGTVDLWNLRQNLLKEICGRNSSTLQVVGDSGQAFEDGSIPRALRILSEQAEAKYVIQYGYTAIHHDTNWLVAELIQQSPEIASRTIANIVEQSIECLQSPLWYGSLSVTNFVFVYKHNEGTNFGDDVWLSDGIMFAASNDKLICFEGGLQAFRQCVNMLLKGIQVMVVAGLRSTETPIRFSAAQFLECLKTTDTYAIKSAADEYLDRVLSNDIEKYQIIEESRNSLLNAAYDWKSLISVL